ncbi:MAG: DUF1257 domain-containing protein [Armatimonadota bacterium]
MSVVFYVVAPAVVAAWPILCGAIAAASGSLGYSLVKSGQEADLETQNTGQKTKLDIHNTVDMPLKDSQIIADTMSRESQFTIQKDDVRATFYRAADGRVSVHISGDNKTDNELETIGQELIGRVTQQYTYNRVLSELKQKGFSVTSEEVANDQTIRIHVSKYV